MEVVNVLPNGNAPSGLSIGDVVKTGGGNYQIVAPGTPGARYSSDSGYWSMPSGSIPYYTGMKDEAVINASKNSALSQAFAREQMGFQSEANAKAMAFNAEQAALNRQWQERMSSTAHQREVLDLVRSGLNPILSANTGASTPSGSAAAGVTSSGASGQVDTSANSVIGGIVNSLVAQATQEKVTAMNNAVELQKTMMSTEASKLIASISADAQVRSAAMNSSAMRYSADRSSYAQMVASANALEGSKYSSDKQLESTKYTSDTNYSIQRDFPHSVWSLPGVVANHTENIMNSLMGTTSGLDASNVLGSLEGLKDVLATNPEVKDRYKQFTHAYD